MSPADPPLRILEQLVSGSVKTYPVTLLEGWRLDEMAARLEALEIVEAQALLGLARDASFVRSRGIDADSLEGYAYPETYRFRRQTSAREVLERMLEEFDARWTDADDELLARSGMSRHQVVALASVVEKESAVPDERRRIAAVFLNRLRRGMRLQSDPTVIYGILVTAGSFDGNLRRRDLERDTPYNTYTRSGIPPGPIAAPSIESIRAVLAPEHVPYLYFVSRNDGTHHFSKTLEEHNLAVDQYQRQHRARKRSEG